jgi:hypothetical protein
MRKRSREDKELHLAVPSGPTAPSPVLSMDQYASWIEEEEQWRDGPPGSDAERCPLPVPVPFRLTG